MAGNSLALKMSHILGGADERIPFLKFVLAMRYLCRNYSVDVFKVPALPGSRYNHKRTAFFFNYIVFVEYLTADELR